MLEAAEQPYPPLGPEGKLRLLVFGGSQGARVMSDVVPPAIERCRRSCGPASSSPAGAGGGSGTGPRPITRGSPVEFEAEPFFKDLPRRLAQAHLVVSRSGASTVAELAVIGRPSILVPLPGSLDQDQAANAMTLGDRRGPRLPQSEFTPERLAAEIQRVFKSRTA